MRAVGDGGAGIMRDPVGWSIPLGRWGGVAVRLQVFFLVFAAATLIYLWNPKSATVPADGLNWSSAVGSMLGMASTVIAGVVVLFLSVMLHEWSHWWAARRYGVAPSTITVGPLGGLTAWSCPGGARTELVILAAGPASNLFACLCCAALIYLQDPTSLTVTLLNPLQPAGAQGTLPTAKALVLTVCAIAVWINWLLFLINLLPARPFDGRQMLRATLTLLRPNMDRRRVAETVFWVAIALSAVLIGVALAMHKLITDAPLDQWFALILLAVILLVSARRDVQDFDDAVPVVLADARKRKGGFIRRRIAQLSKPPTCRLPSTTGDPTTRPWTHSIVAQKSRGMRNFKWTASFRDCTPTAWTA